MHWLSRVRESRQDGQSVRDAISDAQINAGRGIITGTLTTTLCFLTLARSEFTAFAELGIITALGLILMLATTFTLLPAAQVLLPGHSSLNETTWFSNLLTKYTEFVVRNPKVILGLGLVLSIAGIAVFMILGSTIATSISSPRIPRAPDSWRNSKKANQVVLTRRQ